MTALTRFLRHFHRSDDGNGTIEFVIFVPFVFMIFMSTFELGMLFTRQVMLDRGVDMTVRLIRLGAVPNVDESVIRQMVCDRAMIIPDCMNQVKIEMRPLDPRNWGIIPNGADCVNRNDPAIPPRQFTPGQQNELMVIRICALFDPYIPSTGLGSQLPRQSGDAYALVSTASFVIEPTN